eukprot:1189988-Prymnesium_polylepis.1
MHRSFAAILTCVPQLSLLSLLTLSRWVVNLTIGRATSMFGRRARGTTLSASSSCACGTSSRMRMTSTTPSILRNTHLTARSSARRESLASTAGARIRLRTLRAQRSPQHFSFAACCGSPLPTPL